MGLHYDALTWGRIQGARRGVGGGGFGQQQFGSEQWFALDVIQNPTMDRGLGVTSL